MAVGLRARDATWSVGTGDFLHAFFSTASATLEPGGWGTRFPTIMGPLYDGAVDAEQATRALAELDQIAAELAEHPPSAVVWDVADRAKRPPWGEAISADITTLAEYFVTDDGRDLLEVFAEALADAARGGGLRVEAL